MTDAAHIRQWMIRTMPDGALITGKIGGEEGDWAALWAQRNNVTPPPTPAELNNERIRRVECERLNRNNLPSVLAEMPDLYFIPTHDYRVIESLDTWLWHKEERRMWLDGNALDNERIRRGLPTTLRPDGKEW
ncbi:hypothetical protein [Intrasporangium calvum]|uniref:Uncharacterized protein n=1 Tax=Intrasporangium calvum (strain ATCC 23552 / DSM 43043 / JCM 3097 / NBRC 12989 / NCIMB 10167 / NRRL B-3866 / 7 KIP) TaxID=710696 RepID=E6S906_INTC7|nr:hypothetical protein [Intrasporangium calvum]ADU49181.1 hypothetical protein Intca_2679 [Intrasporangium calvum DSM 43043]